VTTVHQIGELDRTGVVIVPTPGERKALARVADRLGVEWRADGSARVYAHAFVGSVALSTDTTFSVTTKVPVANVLRLASMAYRTLRIPPAVGDALLRSDEPALDWLAVLLVTEIQSVLSRGIRQGYVVREDSLPYVRGRMRFDSAGEWAKPGLVACEFADFLPDTPENRVLRTTLEVLVTRRVLPGVRTRAEQLLRSFLGVSLVRPTSSLLASCRIDRLNRRYESALDLCRLFLEQSGIELEPGDVGAPAYFFPMEMVFQEAVATLLRTRLPDVSRQSGRSHAPVSGQPARPLTFAADVVVGSPPRLVIDTKYAPPEVRNRFGGRSFHNDHVYQAAFYALSLGCPAMLVYPRVDQDVEVTFEVEGICISILAIDLEASGMPGLEELVAKVGALTHGADEPPWVQ
jgi:5-methylcytosine-specific restriction enzyme subunit McrC